QTRGWFYSLMTISTLLFEKEPLPHPYKNCLVLGLITDAKGKKLSKRDRNYADPMDMMETHGADAVRWALYANTVPGQGTKFHDGAAVDALRDLLLKVWNVYSFFVTYANIDAWDAKAARPEVAKRSDLDRWILAELDATVRAVRTEMDVYRSHMAVRRISEFNEALSNWYVRRSRDRFWAAGDSADKHAAFATLYEVLVDYAKLLAPFTPFLSELLYQNLVRKVDAGAPESVHLADFPLAVDARVDDTLRSDVAITRSLVGLGLRVRTEQKLKVRQPLGTAIVVIASDDEERAVKRFEDAIRGELNVHAIEFTREPAKYVEFTLVPNFRALGPKLGKDMPACKKVLADADGSKLHAELSANGAVEVTLPSGTVRLGAEDLEIRLSAKEGFAAASELGRVLVLDTRITPELRAEGLAREVVNRIQRARKDMDLAHEARIEVTYQADGELADALTAHAAYIAEETLAAKLLAGTDGKGKRHDDTVDGLPFVFWISEPPK
ncbi:MAG: class I tRNA ligase family protein, partial [Myxococcales bacterium]|nr:class I tRNA ligase family protein [Myxococcales bacterium]